MLAIGKLAVSEKALFAAFRPRIEPVRPVGQVMMWGMPLPFGACGSERGRGAEMHDGDGLSRTGNRRRSSQVNMV